MGPFQSLCLNNVVSNLSEDELQELLSNRRIELEQRRLSTNHLTTNQHHFKDAASKIEVISACSSEFPYPDDERLYCPPIEEGFERETFRRTYKVACPHYRRFLEVWGWRLQSCTGQRQDSEIWMCYQNSNGVAQASCDIRVYDRRGTCQDFGMRTTLIAVAGDLGLTAEKPDHLVGLMEILFGTKVVHRWNLDFGGPSFSDIVMYRKR